jgi:signal transduction histidine kinase/CheY-like chemotaxis protein
MACEPDELIGDKLSDYYVDPNGRQKLLNCLQASPEGKVDCFEAQIRRKDDKIIWLSVNAQFIYDEDGQIQGVEGSLRDITSLKEMEVKFNQAQKMEAVGTLVGGIAHDFNNILAGMVGSFYLIKYKQQNNPELVRDIEALEEQSFRAADMIKQLLTFSRKGEIQTKNFSFSLLMEEVFQLAKRTVPENIMLHIDICKEPLSINGDTSLLQQVLMNLINNSRDAVSGRDSPSIRVIVEYFQTDSAFTKKHPEVALETAYARLSIQDNGCGISEKGLTRVFEPFYTTKGVGEGTGLGLAMIYGSIQSHQGFIEIDSIVNEGTTVDVFLPLVTPDEQQSKNTIKDDVFEGHGEMILCVDDEKDICAVNSELLISLGYQTLQANDGLEAMRLFEQHKGDIALVLTDVIMPNMGGVELAKELWRTHPELPVIFNSGYDENHLLEVPKTMESASILQKPYTVEALSQHVYHLLRK